jgi:hypothetical protein
MRYLTFASIDCRASRGLTESDRAMWMRRGNP